MVTRNFPFLKEMKNEREKGQKEEDSKIKKKKRMGKAKTKAKAKEWKAFCFLQRDPFKRSGLSQRIGFFTRQRNWFQLGTLVQPMDPHISHSLFSLCKIINKIKTSTKPC